MPIIFIAAIDALARIQGHGRRTPRGRARRLGERAAGAWRAAQAGARRYGAAMMVAIAVPLACQFPLNQLWNAQTYQVSPHVEAAEAAMAQVPNGATVLTTLDLLAPSPRGPTRSGSATAAIRRRSTSCSTASTATTARRSRTSPPSSPRLLPTHTYTEIFSSGDVYVFRLTR